MGFSSLIKLSKPSKLMKHKPSNQTRIIFFGTSIFAVPIFEALAHDPRFKLVALVTQPDAPAGRHATVAIPPTKTLATSLGIPVLQWPSIKTTEAQTDLASYPADLAVVASFGQIIPQTILNLYPRGAINLHSSLLPAYRGASPIAGAIRDGCADTGVTLMKMDALMDHGDILTQWRIGINPSDTTPVLEKRLAHVAASHIAESLIDYLENKILPIPQNHDEATFVKLLTREDGALDPTKQTAEHMERLIRAYTPWPGTFLRIDGSRLKIHAATVLKTPPQIFEIGSRIIHEHTPSVVGADGAWLLLTEVQPEGKMKMTGKVFLMGSRTWNKP